VAKKSIVAREQKKGRLVKKFQTRRAELKIKIKSSTDFEEIMAIQAQLAKLPINSSPVRHSTRCQQCGRPHAVYRKFKMCRICIRNRLMAGDLPGGRKSSW
jgi:small subunit ribosomal protein S14